MVKVEADTLVGACLARKARAAGVIYSMAYGDQPALIAEMVDWARSTGFAITAAGKGTKYLPAYHTVTPDDVWEHYGLTADGGREAGMNSQMFKSVLTAPSRRSRWRRWQTPVSSMCRPTGWGFPPSEPTSWRRCCGRRTRRRAGRPTAWWR